MDISAIKKDKFQAWVPFDDDVEVLINYVPRDELAAIGKACVVVSLDPHTRKETRDYDAISADVRIAAAAVADWRDRKIKSGTGFTVDGEPFACTPENIQLLVTKWGEFAKFVGIACVDVAGLAARQREQLEKN
jgi:hypothetical protein